MTEKISTSIPDDPRVRNEWTLKENVGEFFNEYKMKLSFALNSVSDEKLEAAYSIMLQAAKSGKTVFTAGNGGSAAIANHLCCDWTKGTFVEGKIRIKTQSLCANVELMTAMANDVGIEHMFSQQLKIMGSPGDVLFVISSSGNSPNIIQLVSEAKKIGMPVIGFCGFAGGKLKEMADVSIHIPVNNYGIVEDAHQAVMQALAQYFYLKNSK